MKLVQGQRIARQVSKISVSLAACLFVMLRNSKLSQNLLRNETAPKVTSLPRRSYIWFLSWLRHGVSSTLLPSRTIGDGVLITGITPHPELISVKALESSHLLSSKRGHFLLLIYSFKRLPTIWHLTLGVRFLVRVKRHKSCHYGIIQIIRLHHRRLSPGFSQIPVPTTGLSGHICHIETLDGTWEGGRERCGLEARAEDCGRSWLEVHRTAGTEGCVCQGGDFFCAFLHLHDSNKFSLCVEFYRDLVTWSIWVSVTTSREE